MTITTTLSCHPHFNLGLFDSQISLRVLSDFAQTFESTPKIDFELFLEVGLIAVLVSHRRIPSELWTDCAIQSANFVPVGFQCL